VTGGPAVGAGPHEAVSQQLVHAPLSISPAERQPPAAAPARQWNGSASGHEPADLHMARLHGGQDAFFGGAAAHEVTLQHAPHVVSSSHVLGVALQPPRLMPSAQSNGATVGHRPVAQAHVAASQVWLHEVVPHVWALQQLSQAPAPGSVSRH
jgi:hypothetical protein